jgi:hypothetical protein
MRADGSVTVRVRVSDAGLVEVTLSARKDHIATAASVLPSPPDGSYMRAPARPPGTQPGSSRVRRYTDFVKMPGGGHTPVYCC